MMAINRRQVLGSAMMGAGALIGSFGMPAVGRRVSERGALMVDGLSGAFRGLQAAVEFPLVDAIQGRRSRRFAKGAIIPSGPLAFSSRQAAEPLSELEQILLLASVSGITGWSNLIPWNRFYSPGIPNYAAAAGGRSFPSAAGFHTTEVFYTDDNGVYFFATRDMLPTEYESPDSASSLKRYLDAHRRRIVKLADGRLVTPTSTQHMEAHNDWCANVPGSTLIIPVADLAQHHILNLCYVVKNGAGLFDDINCQPIPGLSKFKRLIDPENVYPLSYAEQISLTEVTVESSTSCYAGMLMEQALGLGGWMYGGINPFSILGASGDPGVPGLGFRFDTDPRWPLPNVTGLDGVFEGHCPPHFPSMRAAVESVVERKFGRRGPYNPQTPGPYKESSSVRGAAERHDEEFVDCVTLLADYIWETFGKFPATIPSIFTMMYLQAHQLDTEFYDHHFDAGAYLHTHANHDVNWGN